MKVIVDKAMCIGCGTCVAIAPKSFKLTEDGKVEVIDPVGDSSEAVADAAESCPVNAISIQN